MSVICHVERGVAVEGRRGEGGQEGGGNRERGGGGAIGRGEGGNHRWI